MENVKTDMRIKIEKPAEEKLLKLGVKNWPIWEKEPSTFDWHYDERETCYILEGKAAVITDQGEVNFGKGDLVVFPEDMDCTWKISEKIRKHYNFG